MVNCSERNYLKRALVFVYYANISVNMHVFMCTCMSTIQKHEHVSLLWLVDKNLDNFSFYSSMSIFSTISMYNLHNQKIFLKKKKMLRKTE